MSAEWTWNDDLPEGGSDCYYPSGELAAWVVPVKDCVVWYVWQDCSDIGKGADGMAATLDEGKAAAEAALAELVRS